MPSRASWRRLHRWPTEQELADRIGVPLADIRDAHSAIGCFRPVSLDAPLLADSPTSIGTMVPDRADTFELVVQLETLRPAVENLNARDKLILRRRMVDHRSQAEIASEIGVSQMQVSRLPDPNHWRPPLRAGHLMNKPTAECAAWLPSAGGVRRGNDDQPLASGSPVCGLEVGEGALDDFCRHRAELQMVAAGVVAHQGEGGVESHVRARGEDAFGLLDQEAVVEWALQLLGQDLPGSDGALLQECDGGDVAKRLLEVDVLLAQRRAPGAEEVESPDDLAPQPERQRVGRAEARVPGGRVELWQSLAELAEVDVRDLLPGGVAVQTVANLTTNQTSNSLLGP